MQVNFFVFVQGRLHGLFRTFAVCRIIQAKIELTRSIAVFIDVCVAETEKIVVVRNGRIDRKMSKRVAPIGLSFPNIFFAVVSEMMRVSGSLNLSKLPATGVNSKIFKISGDIPCPSILNLAAFSTSVRDKLPSVQQRKEKLPQVSTSGDEAANFSPNGRVMTWLQASSGSSSTKSLYIRSLAL